MIGDRRLVTNAIEEGIDPNSKTKDGRTAMHLCARIGNSHVLKFLITKCGANANARDLLHNRCISMICLYTNI